MTNMLQRYFARTDETPDALNTLAGAAVEVMFSAISPLGALLASMPAERQHPHATAGASFEIQRAVALVPHRRAAWTTLRERLAEFADRVADQGAPPRVREVGAALHKVAAGLAQHI